MKHPSDRLRRALLFLGLLAFAAGTTRLALAQDDVPPPPEGDAIPAPPAGSAPAAAPAPAAAAAVPTATPTPPPLHSPKEAADYQSGLLKDREKGLEERSSNLDKDQYDLWSRLKGILQYPSVSVHGLGRLEATSDQYFGPGYAAVPRSNPGLRIGQSYLDLLPMGAVGKAVRWDAVFRFFSNLQTGSSNETMDMLKGTLEFNPDFLSATLGDFDESYTPLTLWNRDRLDLQFTPEQWERLDRNARYFNFIDQEPAFPFRGLRVGTQLFWPDSPILERVGASSFAHIVRSGYNDTGDGTTFFGPYQFTDWVFGAKAGVKTRNWDLGGAHLQLGVDAHGLLLDQILDTDKPGSPYDANDTSTWAHQYRLGSLSPNIRIGFGGDLFLGGDVELAYATYQDDKRDATRSVSDYALYGGPSLQLGSAKLSFSFLDVGPDYYSPYAQTRQDVIQVNLNGTVDEDLLGHHLFGSVQRPGGFFTFYDRTLDNTFPYGKATPNRRGYGLDLEAKTLENKALRIFGSAYLVEEMNGNLVVNLAQTGFVPLEDPNGGTLPMRKFLYVNIGPSLDLGPLVGLDRTLEIGANFRYEDTRLFDGPEAPGGGNQLGELKTTWALGSLRVGVLPGCELEGAYSQRSITGGEYGFLGTLYARSTYLYDNKDMVDGGNNALYQWVDMSGTVQSFLFSFIFRPDLHSKFVLDYGMTIQDLTAQQPNLPGDLQHEYMGLNYDVEF